MTSDIEKEKQRLREEIFRDLPPGTEPFTVSPERLAKLDFATRQSVLEEQIFRQGCMRLGIDCPIHRFRVCTHCIQGKSLSDMKSACTFCGGTGQVSQNAPLTFGCRHVAKQDEYHPAGIVFTAKRCYLCRDCWKLAERKKFDFGTEVISQCWLCIREEASRLRMIDPTLLRDFSGDDKLIVTKAKGIGFTPQA